MKTAVNVTCGISVGVALSSAIAHYWMGIRWISIIELAQLTFCLSFWVFGLKTNRFRFAFQLALAADYVGISTSAVFGGDLFLTNVFWLALFPPLYIITGAIRVGYAFFTILVLQVVVLYWRISPDPTSVPAVIITEAFLFAGAMFVFALNMKRWQDRLQIKAAVAEDAILQMKDSKIRHLISINHEIRNPLSAILSAVSLLKLGSQSANPVDRDSQASLLNSLQATCDHLIDIVSETLDHERLSSQSGSTIDVEYVVFEPRTVVLNAVNVLSAMAAEKSLTIACRVASGVHNKYLGPPSKIQQILLNLASNAVQHSGGDVTISIRDEDACLVFAVSDSGGGMSKSKMETLFEPFTSSLGVRGSTGLGLSISRLLTEKVLHGTISVESEVGKGTIFTVKLPLKPAEVEYEALNVLPTSRTRNPDPLNSLEGLRILVVEDDPVNNELTTLVFKKNGMKVASALNSTQALELQRNSGPFDLAVVDNDLGFSKLNGVELSKELIANGLAHVVGFTGNYSQSLTADWHAVGVSQILVKPAKIEDILSALRALTDGANGQKSVTV